MNGMIQPDAIDWKMRGGHHSSDNGGKDGTCYSLEIMSDGSQDKYLEVEKPHHRCITVPNFVSLCSNYRILVTQRLVGKVL